DYAYDGLGILRAEIEYPSWPVTTPAPPTSFSYNLIARTSTRTDPSGQTATSSFDPLNRLVSRTYSDSGSTPTVTFEYDLNGNRIRARGGPAVADYTF